MIASIVRNNKKGDRVPPFLIRFSQKCTPKDVASGDNWQAQNTIITAVRRETTDDR